jgi:class I fructose-bisphosphate aldolase
MGIGFTIYPGSAHRFEMYRQICAYAAEAKQYGWVVVIWSYARGSGLSRVGETARATLPRLPPSWERILILKIIIFIIKVKLPSEHIEQPAARQVYEKAQIPIATLSNRVRPVVQCTFNGRKTAIKRPGQRFT